MPWLGRKNKSKPWQLRNLQKYNKEKQEYNNKSNKSKGVGYSVNPYVTEVENRVVSFTYFIVDSKICLLSKRSREGASINTISG